MRGISVGVPAYNARNTLERAIDSALSQTIDIPFEIVVVDDGSTDTTANIARAYEFTHPGVVRLIRTEHRGVAAARNTVVEAARYSHLTWLDADDIYYPDKLRQQFDMLQIQCMSIHAPPEEPSIMVFSPFLLNGKENTFDQYFGDPIRSILTGEFRAYLWSSMTATMAYREVGPFNETLHRSEDTDWLLRYIKGGSRTLVATHGGPLMEYHFSTQRDGEKVERSFEYLLEAYGQDMKALGIYDEFVPRRFWEISNFYHSNRKWADMWRCRAIAARMSPERYRSRLDIELANVRDDKDRADKGKLVRKFLRENESLFSKAKRVLILRN